MGDVGVRLSRIGASLLLERLPGLWRERNEMGNGDSSTRGKCEKSFVGSWRKEDVPKCVEKGVCKAVWRKMPANVFGRGEDVM